MGTMAGMAVYDMITDDKGNQVKVVPYYVSGEERIPVGTGTVIPKTVTTETEETSTGTIILIAVLAFIVFPIALVVIAAIASNQ